MIMKLIIILMEDPIALIVPPVILLHAVPVVEVLVEEEIKITDL
jgi:hypothetical protein